MRKAWINNIQRYSVNDGGGIRTVVFFQGCPLHCWWCSNPETQPLANSRIYWKNKCIGCGNCIRACPHEIGCRDLQSENCELCFRCVDACYSEALKPLAKEMTVDEVVRELEKDTFFYVHGGGVTLSGGEVLMQWEFAVDVLSEMKESCIDTAIETTGFAPFSHLQAVAEYCDRILFDIKHMDSQMHKKYTGVPNEEILNNLEKLRSMEKEVVIRIPLLHNVNDSIINIKNVADFAKKVGVQQIDILPFHRLGEMKYEALQRPVIMPDSTVPEKTISKIEKFLRCQGFKVSIGG